MCAYAQYMAHSAVTVIAPSATPPQSGTPQSGTPQSGTALGRRRAYYHTAYKHGVFSSLSQPVPNLTGLFNVQTLGVELGHLVDLANAAPNLPNAPNALPSPALSPISREMFRLLV